MSSKVNQVKFVETPEQKKEMDAYLAQYQGHDDAAVTLLEKAQTVYGYLPEEILKRISVALDKSMEELYSIGTFYSQFTLFPKGKYNFSVCLGTACYVNGSQEVLQELKKQIGVEENQCTDDGKLSISVCRCIGCCGLAPVMTVNEDVYGKLTAKDIAGIVNKYKNL